MRRPLFSNQDMLFHCGRSSTCLEAKSTKIFRMKSHPSITLVIPTLPTILPFTKVIGTGPYTLESLEAVRLSPQTQTCPLGTMICSLGSAYWPVGSTQLCPLAFQSDVCIRVDLGDGGFECDEVASVEEGYLGRGYE